MSAHTPGAWPTEWRSRFAPCLPVEMITSRDETGVEYVVLVSEENPHAFEQGEDKTIVWSTTREFGQRDETVAGGEAFKFAAREQERIAEEWVAALAKARGAA